MQSEVAKKAMSNPGKLICEYEEKGYTDDQKKCAGFGDGKESELQ